MPKPLQDSKNHFKDYKNPKKNNKEGKNFSQRAKYNPKFSTWRRNLRGMAKNTFKLSEILRIKQNPGKREENLATSIPGLQDLARI